MTYIQEFEAITQRARKLYYSGNYQEALDLLQQTLHLIDNEQEKLEEGTQLLEISQELEYTSLYFAVQSIFLHNLSVNDTTILLEEKLKEADSSTDYYHDIMDLLGLAQYYGEMNKQEKNFDSAKSHFLEVFSYRKEHSSPLLAYSHFHLGLIYQYSGDRSSALDHFIAADTMSKEQNNPYLESFTTRHLGFLYQQTGDEEQATRLLETSLQLRLDDNILVYVPFSCISLADVYLNQGKKDRARQLYQQAVVIAEMIDLDRALALAHFSLAQFNQTEGEFDTAMNSYLDSYYYSRKIQHEGIMSHIRTKLELKSVNS